MSKQDSHFFNNFSLVLGILFAVTLGLFAFARHVGASHQGKDVTNDPRYIASVDERLKPVAAVAVAGQDNSALSIKSTAPAGPVAAIPANGTAASKPPVSPATVRASRAPRRSATSRPGVRASRRARKPSTTTPCTGSRARPA